MAQWEWSMVQWDTFRLGACCGLAVLSRSALVLRAMYMDLALSCTHLYTYELQ